MPNHIGKCSGPILNEYIDPIYEVRIHVALECEDGECEGYGHPFLALTSWELPHTETYLLDKAHWTKPNRQGSI